MNLMNNKQKDWVERFGFFLEKSGYPPAAARILAFLLINPGAESTFDEVQDGLGLSKGAVSGGLKHLIDRGKVLESKRPGERKRRFVVSLQWHDGVKRFFLYNAAIVAFLKEGLELRQDKGQESSEQMAELVGFLEFLRVEFADVEKRWEEKLRAGGLDERPKRRNRNVSGVRVEKSKRV